MTNAFESMMSDWMEQSQMYGRIGMDMANRMAEAAGKVDGQTSPSDAVREMRGSCLAAMAQATDQIMRSPQTLQLIKAWFDWAITSRKQFDEFMTQMRHAGQATARQDVDSMLASMRHSEHRLLDQMEDLAQRLEAINNRLDAMEQSQRAARNRPREKAEEK